MQITRDEAVARYRLPENPPVAGWNCDGGSTEMEVTADHLAWLYRMVQGYSRAIAESGPHGSLTLLLVEERAVLLAEGLRLSAALTRAAETEIRWLGTIEDRW